MPNAPNLRVSQQGINVGAQRVPLHARGQISLLGASTFAWFYYSWFCMQYWGIHLGSSVNPFLLSLHNANRPGFREIPLIKQRKILPSTSTLSMAFVTKDNSSVNFGTVSWYTGKGIKLKCKMTYQICLAGANSLWSIPRHNNFMMAEKPYIFINVGAGGCCSVCNLQQQRIHLDYHTWSPKVTLSWLQAPCCAGYLT